jgi:hypothetical protein
MSLISFVLIVWAVPNAWVGIALQIVAAAVGAVGTIRVGSSVQILRVDVFHYVTAVSQLALAFAIRAHQS